MASTTEAILSSAEDSRARVSSIARHLEAQSARAEGEDNTLWITADSMVRYINNRFRGGPHAPIRMFEWDLHDLWHTYYLAARHTSYQSPKQDRLALQVLQARHLGTLTGRARGPESQEIEEAVTSDGRIWTDLPFLVSDMTGYWLRNCANTGNVQRLNFTRFLANLASVQTAEDRLSGIALIIFRDALETPRPLGHLDEADQQGEEPSRTMESISIASLLPSVQTWLFVAGPIIIQLSEDIWNGCDHPISHVGELLRQAAVEMPLEGFSIRRWLYWLQRLQEVKIDATRGGDSNLADFCGRMSDGMMITARECGTDLRRALDELGEPVCHQQPILLGPGPEALGRDNIT
jgi:hypothetical protein